MAKSQRLRPYELASSALARLKSSVATMRPKKLPSAKNEIAVFCLRMTSQPCERFDPKDKPIGLVYGLSTPQRAAIAHRSKVRKYNPQP